MMRIIRDIMAELERAKDKHPHWPDDPLHAVAVLNEESGELTQATLDFAYAAGDLERMREEAVQCGAMAIRFLENIDRYRRSGR